MAWKLGGAARWNEGAVPKFLGTVCKLGVAVCWNEAVVTNNELTAQGRAVMVRFNTSSATRTDVATRLMLTQVHHHKPGDF
jgi:hypothetical protein